MDVAMLALRIAREQLALAWLVVRAHNANTAQANATVPTVAAL